MLTIINGTGANLGSAPVIGYSEILRKRAVSAGTVMV